MRFVPTSRQDTPLSLRCAADRKRNGPFANFRAETLLRRLEPRIMYDGAAIATALHVLHHDTAHDGFHVAHAAGDAAAVAATIHGPVVVQAEPNAKSVVFIDANVQDPAAIEKAAGNGAEIVVLDAREDGITQIAGFLAGHSGLQSIHIVSHGAQGELFLGSSVYDAATLKGFDTELAAIGGSLRPGGDILLYGCDVAEGSVGDAFVHKFAGLTHANVAASTDLTGAATVGGNWVLEDHVGAVHTAAINAAGWQGELSPITLALSGGTGGDYATTFTEKAGPVAIADAGAVLSDVTSPTLTSVTVVLTNAKEANSIAASLIVPGITYHTDTSVAGQITLTMSGTVSVSDYQHLVQSVLFNNSSLNPDVTSRTLTVTAYDGATVSNTATAMIAVIPVDDPPVIGGGRPVYVDANHNGQFDAGEGNATFVDGTLPAGTAEADFSKNIDIPAGTDLNQVRTVVDLTQIDNSFRLEVNGQDVVAPGIIQLQSGDTSVGPQGNLVIASTGADLAQPWVVDVHGLPRVEAIITQGHVEFWGTVSPTATVPVPLAFTHGNLNLPQFVEGQNTITVALINGSGADAISGSVAASLPQANETTFTEQGPAVSIVDAGSTVWDIDSANLTGATVVLDQAQAADQLTLPTLPAGVTAITDTSVPGQITVHLTGTATPSAYETIFKGITFSNSSANPSSVDRSIAISVNDGALDSNTYLSTVHVVPVNNPPVETAPAALPVVAGGTVAISGLAVSDVDANGGSETVTLSASQGTLALGSTAGLTFAAGAGNGGGTVVFTGTLADINAAIAGATYTASTGAPGSATISFSTNDNGNTGIGGPLTATQSIAVSVLAPPTANDDAFTTAAGTPVVLDALANDSDPNGFALTVTSINGQAITAGAPVTIDHGTLALNAAGALVFTPTAGYTGLESFTYSVDDGHGGTATATVNGVVAIPLTLDLSSGGANGGYATTFAEKGAPVAIADASASLTDLTGATLTSATVVLTNAKEANSIAASLIVPGITYHTDTTVPGQITLTMTGTATVADYQHLIQSVVFDNTSLNPDTTPRTITVITQDGATISNTATATVNVIPVDDPPVLGAGSPVYVDANHNGQFDPGEANPSFVAGTVPAGTPETDFTKTIDIPAGTNLEQVRVVVDLAQIDNSFKLVVNGQEVVVPAILQLESSDPPTGPQGNLVVAATGSDLASPWVVNAHGLPRVEAIITQGHVEFWGTATPNSTALVPLNFTHGEVNLPSFVTGQNTVSFALVNGAGADAVNGVITASMPQSNVTTWTEHGPAVSIVDAGATAWDVDSPNLASATVVLNQALPLDQLNLPNLPAGITASTDASVPGQITLHLTGAASPGVYDMLIKGITFSNTGANPTAADRTVDITVNDGTLDSNTYVTTVHVIPVDAAPVEVAPLSIATAPGAAITVNGLSVNDVDANGGAETVTLSAAHGTLSLASTVGLTFAPGAANGGGNLVFSGTLADINAAIAGTTYTPAAGYSGADTITFATNDNGNTGIGGPLTASTSIAVTVYAPPAPQNDSFATAAGTPVTVPTLANDSDPNGFALTVSAVNGAPVTVGTPVAVAGGTVTLDASGTFSFAPNAGYAGTPSFTYTVDDGHGGTAMATVNGTVYAPPAPQNDSFATAAGTPVTVPTLANDSDPNGFALTVSAVNGAPVTVGTPVAVAGGTVTLDASGTFSFAPNAGYAGTPSFTYTVDDGHGGTAMATVNGTVYAPPAPQNDSFATAAGTPVTVPTLANDSDPNGFALTVSAVNGAPVTVGTPVAVAGGTVTLDASGSFSFAPNAGYAGTPSFTYTVDDGHGGTAIATVNGTVYAPPAPQNDSFATAAGTPVTVPTLANDSDPNGFALTVSAVNGAPVTVGTPVAVAGGTVTLDASGSFSFAPNAGYAGTPSFTYTVDDGHGGTAMATVNGTVYAPPAPQNDSFATAAGTPVTVPTLANDSDPNGFALTVSAVNGAPVTVGTPVAVAGGTVTLDASGSFSFAPNAGYAGTPSFTYTVDDGHGGTAMATVNGTVYAPPAPQNDSFATAAGTPVTVPTLANDSDPNGFALRIAAIDGHAINASGAGVAVAGGTVTLAADGSLTFLPLPGYSGSLTFNYTVVDGHGGVAVASVTGRVNPGLDLTQHDTGTVLGLGDVAQVVDGHGPDTGDESFGLASGADKEAAFSTGPGEHIRLVVEGALHQIDAQYGAGADGVPMRSMLGVGREVHSQASSVYEAIPEANFWHAVAGLDFSGLPGHGVMVGGGTQPHRITSPFDGSEPVIEAGAVPFSLRMAEIRGRFDRSGLRLSADLARVA